MQAEELEAMSSYGRSSCIISDNRTMELLMNQYDFESWHHHNQTVYELKSEKLGGRVTNKVCIIAEAGVNHNGDLELARKLIKVASEAGADYVKFQSFKADSLVCKNAKKLNIKFVILVLTIINLR